MPQGLATTVTSIDSTSITVTISGNLVNAGATSYDIKIYTSASQPVTANDTLVDTFTNQTSPATLTISPVLGNYYAAVAIANFNSVISASQPGPALTTTTFTTSTGYWDCPSGVTTITLTLKGGGGGGGPSGSYSGGWVRCCGCRFASTIPVSRYGFSA